MSDGGNNQHGGPMGGVTRTRTRSAMAFLQKRLEAATTLHEGEWAATVLFARTVRDDPKASARDRIRAAELLASLSEKGIDVAEKVDKLERLDAGEVTDRAEHTHKFIKGVGGESL